jgi:hypothetical protein
MFLLVDAWDASTEYTVLSHPLLAHTEVLDLGNNSLVGTIPSFLGAISSLSEFSVTANGNVLFFPTSHVFRSSQAHLFLNDNSFTGATIPIELASSQTLSKSTATILTWKGSTSALIYLLT